MPLICVHVSHSTLHALLVSCLFLFLFPPAFWSKRFAGEKVIYHDWMDGSDIVGWWGLENKLV